MFSTWQRGPANHMPLKTDYYIWLVCIIHNYGNIIEHSGRFWHCSLTVDMCRHDWGSYKGQAAAEADVPSARAKKKKKKKLYVESIFHRIVYFEAPRCCEHVDVLYGS